MAIIYFLFSHRIYSFYYWVKTSSKKEREEKWTETIDKIHFVSLDSQQEERVTRGGMNKYPKNEKTPHDHWLIEDFRLDFFYYELFRFSRRLSDMRAH